MSQDWAEQLLKGLETYTDEVTEQVKEAVKETADETVALLKTTSPIKAKGKKRGKYRRGWRAKNTSDKTAACVMTVYNATDYQLTHLLENGHVNRDGSFTAARPHIAAAEEYAKTTLENKVESIIKKG